jgi:hypothetical protein
MTTFIDIDPDEHAECFRSFSLVDGADWRDIPDMIATELHELDAALHTRDLEPDDHAAQIDLLEAVRIDLQASLAWVESRLNWLTQP